MNQNLDNAIKDLLTDDKEFSYVVSTDHPVFKQFGLSTFTSGQLYQFLQTDNTIRIPDISVRQDVPYCEGRIAGTQWACEEAPADQHNGAPPGTWVTVPEDLILSHDPKKTMEYIFDSNWSVPGWWAEPNGPPDSELARGAEFIRFDVLKKTDELEQLGTNERWSSRYNIRFYYMQGADGTFQSQPQPHGRNGILAVIGMNDENIAGRLEAIAGEEPAVAGDKISKKQFLYDLTTSMSGCIRWSVPIAFDFGGGCTPNEVVDFKLYVFDKSQSDNADRRIALRGSPLIVGVPTTAHGISYAGGRPTTGGMKGEYPAVEFGGDTNPNNITTGELSTSYNPNTGKFEAGTSQILARLLTDVEAVALNKLDGGGLADDLTEADISPTGNYALGNFTVGEAMPMGVHNGNPYDFGPYFVGGDCHKNTKHKIRVVNRCPKPFPKGQIVMCSKIDNEWIIMDFGYKDTDEMFFETGNWRFCSMIANKDAYFKDERHTYDPMDTMPGDKHQLFPGMITEQKYEYAFRWKYWKGIQDTQLTQIDRAYYPMMQPSGGDPEAPTSSLSPYYAAVERPLWDDANIITWGSNPAGGWAPVVALNGVLKAGVTTNVRGGTITTPTKFKDNPNVFGSRRYHQVSSFDFMHAGGGGWRYQPYFRRCNPMMDLDGSKPDKLGTQAAINFFPMFGPIFPDGYDEDQVAAIDADPLAKRGMSYGETSKIPKSKSPGEFWPPDISAMLINFSLTPSAGSQSIQGASKPSAFAMFPPDDPTASQLPADVGHNAKPYSDDGCPLDDQNMMLGAVNVVTSNEYTPFVKDVSDSSSDSDIPAQLIGDGDGGWLTDFPLVRGVQKMFKHVKSEDEGVLGYTHERRHQSRWQWYGKESEGSTTPFGPDSSQSAWGLKPNNTNKITFMPLTLEHLTSYDYIIGTGNYYRNVCGLIGNASITLTGEQSRAHFHAMNHYPQGVTPGAFGMPAIGTCVQAGGMPGYGEFDAAYNILGGVSPSNFKIGMSRPLGHYDVGGFLWPDWALIRNHAYRNPWNEGSPPKDIGNNIRGHDYVSLAANYPGRDLLIGDDQDSHDKAMDALTESMAGGFKQTISDHTCVECQIGPMDETGVPPTKEICGYPMPSDFIPPQSYLDIEGGSVPCWELCTEFDDDFWHHKDPNDNTSDYKCGTCCRYPSTANRGSMEEYCRCQGATGEIFGEDSCARNGRLTGPEREWLKLCQAKHDRAVEAQCEANKDLKPSGVDPQTSEPNGTYVPPWKRPCSDPAAAQAALDMGSLDMQEPPKHNSRRGFPYGVYSRDQHDYGNFPNGPHPDGHDGVETVGIITGKTTIRVGGFEVGVMTNNYVGLPRVQATSAAVSTAYGNWGVKSEGIDSMATTATFAKMYTAWPDEQTIFDPRYFAVMHFNPGELFTVPSGLDQGNRHNPVKEPYIWVDAIETEVDYRIPTLYGKLEGQTIDTNPPEADLGKKVYNEKDDPTKKLSEQKSLKEARIRPDRAEWKVATHRRGQLLPYSYWKKTIGLPFHKNAYHMAGSGVGYKVGDLFEAVGGQGEGTTLVVTKVNDDANEGPIGAILDFSLGITVSNVMPDEGEGSFPKGYDKSKFMGRDYAPRDFVSVEDIAKIKDPKLGVVTTAPKISFKAKTRTDGKESKGLGCLIYALYGLVYAYKEHDYGPKKQQPTMRVSAASQNGLAGDLEGREYSSRLGITEPTTEGYYDVFIHFHNDISHTTANAYDTRYTLGYQQFVNLELRGV